MADNSLPPEPPLPSPSKTWLFWRAALIGFLTTGALTALVYLISLDRSGKRADWIYSYGLFLYVPVALGISSGLALPRTKNFGPYVKVAMAALLLGAVTAVFAAAEGLVCLLMASPVLVGASMLGALVAWLIRGQTYRGRAQMSVLILLPAALFVDIHQGHPPAERRVTTQIVIHASPDRIWPLIHNFDNLPAPDFWLFRNGVAYPLGAKTFGKGVGSERHCLLSTGDMREVVEQWVPNRLLRFRVLETPACMTEVSIYGHIDTPHLHGYYECEEGEFRLTPLPNGDTLLEGTSWYRYHLYPAAYWGIWTDMIVHQVHLRVLNEIKKRAEAAGEPSGSRY
jgi:hypothetical protein